MRPMAADTRSLGTRVVRESGLLATRVCRGGSGADSGSSRNFAARDPSASSGSRSDFHPRVQGAPSNDRLALPVRCGPDLLALRQAVIAGATPERLIAGLLDEASQVPLLPVENVKRLLFEAAEAAKSLLAADPEAATSQECCQKVARACLNYSRECFNSADYPAALVLADAGASFSREVGKCLADEEVLCMCALGQALMRLEPAAPRIGELVGKVWERRGTITRMPLTDRAASILGLADLLGVQNDPFHNVLRVEDRERLNFLHRQAGRLITLQRREGGDTKDWAIPLFTLRGLTAPTPEQSQAIDSLRAGVRPGIEISSTSPWASWRLKMALGQGLCLMAGHATREAVGLFSQASSETARECGKDSLEHLNCSRALLRAWMDQAEWGHCKRILILDSMLPQAEILLAGASLDLAELFQDAVDVHAAIGDRETSARFAAKVAELLKESLAHAGVFDSQLRSEARDPENSRIFPRSSHLAFRLARLAARWCDFNCDEGLAEFATDISNRLAQFSSLLPADDVLAKNILDVARLQVIAAQALSERRALGEGSLVAPAAPRADLLEALASVEGSQAVRGRLPGSLWAPMHVARERALFQAAAALGDESLQHTIASRVSEWVRLTNSEGDFPHAAQVECGRFNLAVAEAGGVEASKAAVASLRQLEHVAGESSYLTYRALRVLTGLAEQPGMGELLPAGSEVRLRALGSKYEPHLAA